MKKITLTCIIAILLLSFINISFAEDDAVGIKPGTSIGETSTVYRLLAPLAVNGKGVTCIDTNTKNPNQNCAKGGIGDYLNIIFNLGVGLCAALAVVYIVIGGIQWMGDESVFGKTEAKGKIGSAILGLLIALGAYALLNTINPDLLGKGGVTVTPAEIKLEEPITADPANVPSAPAGKCKTKIVAVGRFHACQDIADGAIKLLDAAKAAGINLGGGGFRTRDEQIALRIKNCNGNTTDPNAKCNPPTATPGNSNHESGFAFDFTCDGSLIRAADNKCFVWLKSNAGPLLKNFPPEPWHWSVDGR